MPRKAYSDVEYYRRDLNRRVVKLEKILKYLDAKLDRKVLKISQQVKFCPCMNCFGAEPQDPPEEPTGPIVGFVGSDGVSVTARAPK